MDSLLDRASPRRGSLNSLHKYPNSAHNSKLGSPAEALQVNCGNLYALCKDLDKFTRYFIVKVVQVIVQSRLGSNHKLRNDCKPNGNDWFNLNISDIAEVSDKTKAVLDSEGLSVKYNWRVCCEISFKTNDGSKVVLEHWVISNKTNLNSTQKLSNSGQASPKGYTSNKSPNVHLNSINANGVSPLCAVNTSTSRTRPATFSHTSRTRLNSIDDTVGDNNFVTNKLLMGVTNENFDIKQSTSCFTLSSAQLNHNHQSDGNNLIHTSPSINSLNANTTNSNQDNQMPASNNSNPSTSHQQTQHPQSSPTTSKTSATSSIYTIYNRMSLLLKTLLTTAHIVPAHRLASRISQMDSCVISYRVYVVPRQCPTSRGSTEDINSNINQSESPSKRSLISNSSLGSVDIRDFVSPDKLEHFCPMLKLGSIKTDVSEINVSVCYRTDIRSSNFFTKNPKSNPYNRILDEDCLTAAKQLLAGNDCLRDDRFNQYNHPRNGSQNSVNYDPSGSATSRRALDFLDQPLKPAFASLSNNNVNENQDRVTTDNCTNGSTNGGSGCELIELAFDELLRNKYSPNEDILIDIASKTFNKSSARTGNLKSPHRLGKTSGAAKSANASSEPIQVPGTRIRNQSEHLTSLTPGSTPKSLTDSYVFVDLNPPFASDEQNDINSFFHGPAPSFTNGSNGLGDVDELTSQLATFEANASQIDDFVDNMCTSEDEHEEDFSPGDSNEN